MKLRIADKYIRTNNGGEAISNCKQLFKLAQLVRRRGKELNIFSSAEIDKYNDTKDLENRCAWTLYRISKRGTIEIGCEFITYKQMLPIAKKLGFRRLD